MKNKISFYGRGKKTLDKQGLKKVSQNHLSF